MRGDESPWLIVPAAGRGTRMGSDRPKQYLPLGARTVMGQTLARLHSAWPEATLMLCLDADDDWFDETAVPFARWQRVSGGEARWQSVRAALHALDGQADDEDWVLVHDVARPCVTAADLARLLAALRRDRVGGLLATPVTDTLKRQDDTQRVAATPSREGLWRAMTPQGFRFGVLRRALEHACSYGVAVTDEASAVEALGLSPLLVAGRSDNIKITHPEDLRFAAMILESQRDAS
ncbi:2-C-methyl-D-erythritol 4-phosphate cytidylyltransferase [Kushneria sinocarnis]|uniref:2-C-methyl-D-erythritol 4-phosphate cytidylyltransferase n=1 Tax=Kushneria sinocarnis TaxID=595502 RepID=A0A420WX21_9GAMM|nr:2-C-methyl-D-erythritol 4-phosphate cytidylyltransferase [Kushneria sinocarnis]RKR04276.1 2-C-methyl-D-erythritol 4-phosphate cytidylyltransferase [Kushneria sinocarnis]